jgi:hypothetical protein
VSDPGEGRRRSAETEIEAGVSRPRCAPRDQYRARRTSWREMIDLSEGGGHWLWIPAQGACPSASSWIEAYHGIVAVAAVHDLPAR